MVHRFDQAAMHNTHMDPGVVWECRAAVHGSQSRAGCMAERDCSSCTGGLRFLSCGRCLTQRGCADMGMPTQKLRLYASLIASSGRSQKENHLCKREPKILSRVSWWAFDDAQQQITNARLF